MATLVLSAAGAALGGSLGGSLLGISTLVAGKAIGATLGSIIDQRLLGAGSAPVETGRLDRLRIMGSSEGAPLPRVFGRMRVAGQLIWSSRFVESVATQRVGGKGRGRSGQTVRQYGYSVSFAVALCEGEVMRVGRIWADGQPLAQGGITWRLHRGSEDQLPDPLIAAVEGAEEAPAYRGTAYVVFEELDLAPFGNRIPQLNLEVFRRPDIAGLDLPPPPSESIRGVALVPGTGEYALATEPVALLRGRGDAPFINVNNDRGEPDFVVSMDQLADELPHCRAVSLVVSWFGDDLRAGHCALYPAVEQQESEASQPWSVAGATRGNARRVSYVDGRPLFGGTPSDSTVVQAIRRMDDQGLAVMFYPFILMDIVAGNTLDNPWAPGSPQPAVPWRGRITLSRAPGLAGSPDRSPAAAQEVAAFFGTASGADFVRTGDTLTYAGPNEWSYRRFILHYAHLCALAGGVDSFCIGSEMRSLTQIRSGPATYPAVEALRALAAEVRTILGPGVKIGYAADWSEYFGHQPDDGSGDALFHLDPLWADPAIDFVGIDNYMPISDWRDGSGHLDAAVGSPYDLDYLASNVAGGEGFDWFYPNPAARDAQDRIPITDGAHGEPWVFRYKDLLSWWSEPHHDRLGGQRSPTPTGWVPKSKPIWFTELGCPAVDKGTNQPNVFFDPKSSESFVPHYSNGQRDDFVQRRYLQASFRHWYNPANNPLSEIYGDRMVDMDRAFVWAWDSRPWPDFPARMEQWIDGANYELGHWLNGRIAAPSIAEVVGELCARAGADGLALGDLDGSLTGYMVSGSESARQSLQPLIMAYGLDCVAEGEKLVFRSRSTALAAALAPDMLVDRGAAGTMVQTRSADGELVGRVSVGYIRADADYQVGAAEAVSGEVAEPSRSDSGLPLVLWAEEAGTIARRWLAESRAARDTMVFALPPSDLRLVAGDLIALAPAVADTLRIDRISEGATREITATRVAADDFPRPPSRVRSGQHVALTRRSSVDALLLDLPLLTGEEVAHAPHFAAFQRPWTGPVALYTSSQDADYRLAQVVDRPATLGVLMDPLPRATPGQWMPWHGRIRLDAGALQSRDALSVLGGANAALIGSPDDQDWEVIQFRSADMIGPRTYRLDLLLRGQRGSDASMAGLRSAGTDFLLIDDALRQIDLAAALRGVERHYRFGPADQPYSDASFIHRVARFAGIGLRPYAPVHLRARRQPGGAIEVTWIRRSRVEGDSWEGLDVPIGEERLRFDLAIEVDGVERRRMELDGTAFTYSLDQQQADGAGAGAEIVVAQLSERFGPGPAARVTIPAAS